MATARKTIHARPLHLGKIHNRPRFDGVFDAVTITVYYWKKYQAYLVLIYDKTKKWWKALKIDAGMPGMPGPGQVCVHI